MTALARVAIAYRLQGYSWGMVEFLLIDRELISGELAIGIIAMVRGFGVGGEK